MNILLPRVRRLPARKVGQPERKYAVLLAVFMMLFSLPAMAKTYGVVVSGLGGTPDYQEAFDEASRHFNAGLLSLENDPSLIRLLDEKVTRESILAAIDEQAARIQRDMDSSSGEVFSEPVFVLMLTGHGNADSDGWLFNVAGPDLSSSDLIAALNGVPTARQLVVLAASASGAALDSLSQLGRVLVTATKSGGEINAIRFHKFLADAMQSDSADYDRNEILTIAEAYRFAESRTIEYFEQQNLLASEHSRLRGEDADDIAVALLGSLRDAKDDPIVAGLLDQRLVLEQTFKALRLQKENMPVEDYYNELETLLLSIARLQQSIDKATGWSDGDANS
ncbi:MAG: hypothetical protein AB8B97_03450 [Granulosicoccus sp.]